MFVESDPAPELEAGQVYDPETLRVTEWTTASGQAEGRNLFDYFDGAGRYLGPDVHGVEPIVEVRDYHDPERWDGQS